ncbi:MAG: 4Fe-4S dicluster domain-containing protein, partial [Ktedonobacteraceae bacterium]
MLGLFNKEAAPPPQPALGFFTDTSLCIGCKACEVACKQWNQLPARDPSWTGTSYDNTQQLDATTWRHVQFIEKFSQERLQADMNGGNGRAHPDIPLLAQTEVPLTLPGTALPFFNSDRWLMRSDVCKHCANAPCQEACPTGAIIRTEFDT